MTAPTCGNELAESAVVPSAIAALMAHVAENLDAHARWVGVERPEAKCEHDAMRAVPQAYRGIATSASDAAALMRSFDALPAAPRDHTKWDRPSFVEWTRKKLELQRELVRLLLEHIALSERAMQNGS